MQRVAFRRAFPARGSRRHIAIARWRMFRRRRLSGVGSGRVLVCRGDRALARLLPRSAAASTATPRLRCAGFARRRRRSLARLSFRRRSRALAALRTGLRRLRGRRRVAWALLVAWILRRRFSRVQDRLLQLCDRRM